MTKESMLNLLKEKSTLVSVLAFCVLAFAVLLTGAFALHTPVVAMCVLVMLEAGIAVMLHRAKVWIHAVMVMAELVAGIITGRVLLVFLCAVMYVMAIVVLQMLGRDE
ncbi:MAG: hypothetical protein NC180_08025 [Muribaculaceae bacterium]|nr:hypothetical protein [Roseburia sp.]MCM1430480.1 hypothetical protein [Muribaculaceae bacterium]MCM1493153.1 hypothetical protein [Muribaculaceae bacterium]